MNLLFTTLLTALLHVHATVAGPANSTHGETIVDLALETKDLSTLVAALKAGSLVDTLSGPGPFTVFAPTNEAFAALPAGVLANLLKPENKNELVDLLTYHVVSGTVHSKNIWDGEMLKTVEGKYVTLRVSGKDIFVNSAKVITADIDASNGVIHIIDAVLMPGPAPSPPAPTPAPPASNTIVDLALGDKDLSTLVTALKAGDLVDTLSGPGPFTVFAPTNEAFAALPAGALANLLKPENKNQLVDLLTYHVVPGTILAKNLLDGERLKTVEGKSVMVKISGGDVFINGAKVTTPNLIASNGVVHIISAVLSPSTPNPPPTPTNHLYFRGWTGGGFNVYQCGEVDAAPRMPSAIFEPSNAAALKAYEVLTIEFYRVIDILSVPLDVNLELGRCSDNNYNISAGTKTVDWAPSVLMNDICAKQCHCSFKGNLTSSLPQCTDEPDNPKAGTWCSLCGPKFNAPITINLYSCHQAFNAKLCPGPAHPHQDQI